MLEQTFLQRGNIDDQQSREKMFHRARHVCLCVYVCEGTHARLLTHACTCISATRTWDGSIALTNILAVPAQFLIQINTHFQRLQSISWAVIPEKWKVMSTQKHAHKYSWQPFHNSKKKYWKGPKCPSKSERRKNYGAVMPLKTNQQ